MTFCWSQRSVSCPVIIREAPPVIDGNYTEIHNWTMYRKWETLEHSVLNPLLGAQGAMQKRQKDSKSQSWWMTPRKQCRPDTGPMLMWIHRGCGGMPRACTGPRVPVLRGESRHDLPTLIKTTTGEEKLVFAKEVSLGILTMVNGRPHAWQ